MPGESNHVQRLVYAGAATSVAIAIGLTAFFLSRLVTQLDNLEIRTTASERRVDNNELRLNTLQSTLQQILDEQRNIKRLIQPAK